MDINIHPLFVHFPIALLTLYSLFELADLTPLKRWSHLSAIKKTFLGLGTIGALATFQTGLMAERLITAGGGSAGDLVATHKFWAFFTMILFSSLSALYLMEWHFAQKAPLNARVLKLWAIFRPILALVGLLGITATGVLGGAIVYGPEADPFIKALYPLLVK